MKKISVIGLGNFGYAFLRHLDYKNSIEKEFNLLAFDRKPDLIESLRVKNEHTYLHQGFRVSEDIELSNDLDYILKQSDIILLAVPSVAIRDFVRANREYLTGKIIVNTAKALEKDTGKTLQRVFEEEMGEANYIYTFVAGGTIASDLFLRYPLGLTLAGSDSLAVQEVKSILEYSNLSVYTSDDVEGAEYAASFKNIISILAGIIKGMGYSYGSETHYISRIAQEVEDLVIKNKIGDTKTFGMGSQCWGNDMWMSATGKTRNREFGELLGSGVSVQNAKQIMKMKEKTIEGVNTVAIVGEAFDLEEYPMLNFMYKFVGQEIADLDQVKDI